MLCLSLTADDDTVITNKGCDVVFVIHTDDTVIAN